jgi:hypothetical protein
MHLDGDSYSMEGFPLDGVLFKSSITRNYDNETTMDAQTNETANSGNAGLSAAYGCNG